ncbi:MAG: hypothetical protein M2R45_02898 [Verrucomicrobia subdivision 3 bacterium]|nr:hypothetical protein [Limisphaerales bacterium]MCS1414750.1 hypothetical protein [Limisphaerales bacterium]
MVEEPNNEPENASELQRPFFGGAMILFESSLVVIAWILAWIFGVPLFADFRWDAKSAFLGLSSTIPMLAMFVWIVHSDYPPFVEIRKLLSTFIGQGFGECPLIQIALLSLAAGVGEEVLFRAVLQSGIAAHSTPLLGILAASLLFALCHSLSIAYFIIIFIIGIYLSLVWHAAGNLLAPMITHAVYDFIALCYLIRQCKHFTPGTQQKKADS